MDVEGITKLIKASGAEVENFWPGMFAKALAGANISDLCTKISGENPQKLPLANALVENDDRSGNNGSRQSSHARLLVYALILEQTSLLGAPFRRLWSPCNGLEGSRVEFARGHAWST